jgi:hypothetical protein
MLIILIHNDGTGTNEDANYTYQVRINDGVIAVGDIRGHDRRSGWQELVKELVRKNEKTELVE